MNTCFFCKGDMIDGADIKCNMHLPAHRASAFYTSSHKQALGSH